MKTCEHEWIMLTHWNDYFVFPSYGSMRNIVARRKENGAEKFLSMVNNRFYVNVPAFNEWMKNTSLERTGNVKASHSEPEELGLQDKGFWEME